MIHNEKWIQYEIFSNGEFLAISMILSVKIYYLQITDGMILVVRYLSSWSICEKEKVSPPSRISLIGIPNNSIYVGISVIFICLFPVECHCKTVCPHFTFNSSFCLFNHFEKKTRVKSNEMFTNCSIIFISPLLTIDHLVFSFQQANSLIDIKIV